MHLNKPANFTYRFSFENLWSYHRTLKGYLPKDISPWLFQRGHFQMPFILHIFSTLSVKYKASKILPKYYVTKSLIQFFSQKVTTLCRWFYRLVSRMKSGQIDTTLKCQENNFLWNSINLTIATRKIYETRKYE